MYLLIVFTLNVCDISGVINLVLTSACERSFMMKKLEKWEIFNFADFHFKTYILPFYKPTIQTVNSIAVNSCTFMPVSYKTCQFFPPCTFSMFINVQNITPTPLKITSKLHKIGQNILYLLNSMV